MPAEYEAIRDSYLRSGKSDKEAKRIAAMTWNKEHPGNTNPWNKDKKRRAYRK